MHRFSDQVADRSKIKFSPARMGWHRSGPVPCRRFAQTLWLRQAVGASFQFTGQDLSEAHRNLHIKFNELGVEIVCALDHFSGPDRKKQSVLAAIVSKETEVVGVLPNEICLAPYGRPCQGTLRFVRGDE